MIIYKAVDHIIPLRRPRVKLTGIMHSGIIHATERSDGCVVPLVPLESRAPQRRSLPRCAHPTAASRRPASAPATGFSEGDIAPAACPVILPSPQVAQKPQHGPRLMTYWLRAGAALAAFAAADIELSVDAMLPALTEAKASSLLARGPKERPPHCPHRRQERRE